MYENNFIQPATALPQVLTEQWQAFRGSGDATARTFLIEHYLKFARIIAARTYALRIDNSVLFEDYVQYARVGLLEAVDRYDLTTGVAFEGFAVHRIRGAILNGLGSETELAAQRKVGLPSSIVERLESLDQNAIEAVPDDMLGKWVDKVIGIAIGRLLESHHQEPIDESAHANPYARVELAQLRRRLKMIVDKLPGREAEVIRFHYFEHQEFQWIADHLMISKGRVSQLHAKALCRMRLSLKSLGEVDAAV